MLSFIRYFYRLLRYVIGRQIENKQGVFQHEIFFLYIICHVYYDSSKVMLLVFTFISETLLNIPVKRLVVMRLVFLPLNLYFLSRKTSFHKKIRSRTTNLKKMKNFNKLVPYTMLVIVGIEILMSTLSTLKNRSFIVNICKEQGRKNFSHKSIRLSPNLLIDLFFNFTYIFVTQTFVSPFSSSFGLVLFYLWFICVILFVEKKETLV